GFLLLSLLSELLVGRPPAAKLLEAELPPGRLALGVEPYNLREMDIGFGLEPMLFTPEPQSPLGGGCRWCLCSPRIVFRERLTRVVAGHGLRCRLLIVLGARRVRSRNGQKSCRDECQSEHHCVLPIKVEEPPTVLYRVGS